MQFKFAALPCALLLLASGVTSSPIAAPGDQSNNTLEERGLRGTGILFYGLDGLGKGIMMEKAPNLPKKWRKDEWLNPGPPNSFMKTGEYTWNGRINPTYDPKPWWSAWYPGENEFLQKDADVAKCIIDLHSNQKDVCISVKGSPCDNGYIKGGGQIMNIQNNQAGKTKIPKDDAKVMKVALQSMVGVKMRTDLTNGNAFEPVIGA